MDPADRLRGESYPVAIIEAGKARRRSELRHGGHADLLMLGMA
jgi:hypothetical protein